MDTVELDWENFCQLTHVLFTVFNVLKYDDAVYTLALSLLIIWRVQLKTDNEQMRAKVVNILRESLLNQQCVAHVQVWTALVNCIYTKPNLFADRRA